MNTPPDPPADVREALARLRAEIERIDRELVQLLGQRVQLARQVGAVKQRAGMPALDAEREAAVRARAGDAALALGLPPEEVRALFDRIIEVSRRAQDTGG